MNELYRDYLVIAFGRFDERTASWHAAADISREGSFKTLTWSRTHKDRQEAERVARELAVDWIDRQFQRV